MRVLEQHRKRYKQEVFLTARDLAVTETDEKFLKDLEKILNHRLSDPDFGPKELADALYMSRMQLHRKIKALTGLSASAFLRSQRLKNAARLLQTTDLPVGEIAFASGFNNTSYFIRLFKKTYDMTPAEFREQKN